MAKLEHETWEQLVQLTVDFETDQFEGILKQLLGVDKLSQLTEEQGREVVRALSMLPKVRKLLLAAAEDIMHKQTEAFAIQLIETQVDRSLFERDSEA